MIWKPHDRIYYMGYYGRIIAIGIEDKLGQVQIKYDDGHTRWLRNSQPKKIEIDVAKGWY